MAKYTTKEIYLTDCQIKKLAASVAKQRSVSLKSNLQNKTGTLTKLMLTKTETNNLDKKKPFILNLSKSQITAMSRHGGFFGPAIAT